MGRASAWGGVQAAFGGAVKRLGGSEQEAYLPVLRPCCLTSVQAGVEAGELEAFQQLWRTVAPDEEAAAADAAAAAVTQAGDVPAAASD